MGVEGLRDGLATPDAELLSARLTVSGPSQELPSLVSLRESSDDQGLLIMRSLCESRGFFFDRASGHVLWVAVSDFATQPLAIPKSGHIH